MTKTNLKLASTQETPQSGADDRAELRAAIQKAASATRALEAAKAKLASSDNAVATVTSELEKARADVGKAKERAIAAASAGREGTKEIASARSREQAAFDAVEIAQGVRDAIAAKLVDLEAAKTRAENEVGRCINAVVAAEMRHIIDDCEALKIKLFEKIGALCDLRFDRDAQFVPSVDDDPGASARRMNEIDRRTAPLDQLRDQVDHV